MIRQFSFLPLFDSLPLLLNFLHPSVQKDLPSQARLLPLKWSFCAVAAHLICICTSAHRPLSRLLSVVRLCMEPPSLTLHAMASGNSNGDLESRSAWMFPMNRPKTYKDGGYYDKDSGGERDFSLTTCCWETRGCAAKEKPVRYRIVSYSSGCGRDFRAQPGSLFMHASSKFQPGYLHFPCGREGREVTPRTPPELSSHNNKLS